MHTFCNLVTRPLQFWKWSCHSNLVVKHCHHYVGCKQPYHSLVYGYYCVSNLVIILKFIYGLAYHMHVIKVSRYHTFALSSQWATNVHGKTFKEENFAVSRSNLYLLEKLCSWLCCLSRKENFHVYILENFHRLLKL